MKKLNILNQKVARLLASIVTIVVLLGSVNSSANTITWSDDFGNSDLNEWNTDGLVITANSSHVDYVRESADASVVNGRLVVGEMVGNTPEDNSWTVVEHNSSVLYGSWSFDWDRRLDTVAIGSMFHFLAEELFSTWWSVNDVFNKSKTVNGLDIRFGDWGVDLESIVDSQMIKHATYRGSAIPSSYDGIQHFEIQRHLNNTIKVFVDNKEVISVTSLGSSRNQFFSNYQTNCITVFSSPNTHWDNFAVSEYEDPNVGLTNDGFLDANWPVIISATIFTAIFATVLYSKPKKKLKQFRRKRHIRKSQAILQTFSDVFSDQQLFYLAILGQSTYNQTEKEQKFRRDVPDEITQYRFLMHPIRLSIMKILYNNFSQTSVEIKQQVNMSWGEYASHISALEKNGFISVHVEFIDGMKANIVYLEEVGRQEYEKLISLLRGFLEDAGPNFYDNQPDLYPAERNNDL